MSTVSPLSIGIKSKLNTSTPHNLWKTRKFRFWRSDIYHLPFTDCNHNLCMLWFTCADIVERENFENIDTGCEKSSFNIIQGFAKSSNINGLVW